MDLKVAIVGQSFAGKSSLANRFVFSDFNKELTSTSGAAFLRKTVETRVPEYKTARLQIWDTAG